MIVGLFSGRNSDRLGNGVLYASVNPEYFSAAESECVCVRWRVCVCVFIKPLLVFCSVRARRVGGGPGEDLPEP